MADYMADALADCLEAVETGQATQEECLAQYPGDSAELAPLLLLATTLQQAPTVAPRGP